MCNQMRMAIALSGGVDSSITALFLSRCVYTFQDVCALWCTSVPIPSTLWSSNNHSTSSFCSTSSTFQCCSWTPSYETVREAILYKLPWHTVHPFYKESKEECTGVNWTRNAKAAIIEYVPLYMRNWIDDVDYEKEEKEQYNEFIYNDNNNNMKKTLSTLNSKNKAREHAMWCSQSEVDYNDAHTLAHELALIPENTKLPIVDLSAEYMDRCFNPMLNAYAHGQTLNVDVLCNSEIKFDALLEHFAKRNTHGYKNINEEQSCLPNKRDFKYKKSSKIDLLATGHYVRSVHFYNNSFTESHPLENKKQEWEYKTRAESNWSNNFNSRNAKAKDRSVLLGCPVSANNDLNDQSLFLSYVSSHLSRKGVFPCGHLFTRKADLRALALDLNESLHIPILTTIAHKKTSTGLCFVGQWARSRKKEQKQFSESKENDTNCRFNENNNCSECLLKGISNGNVRQTTKLQKLSFANFLDQYIISPEECVPSKYAKEFKSDSTDSDNHIYKTMPGICDQEKKCNAATIFRDIEHNKLLDECKFVSLPTLSTHYPDKLPSFALTIGQRLLYMSDHSDHNNSNNTNIEKCNNSDFNREKNKNTNKRRNVLAKREMSKVRHSYETYFVCKKVHAETKNYNINVAMAPVAALLDEVHLVHTWNHTELYHTEVNIQKIKVHITLEQLHKLVENYNLCYGTKAYNCMTLKCLCVIRHQDKPQPAVVQWEQEHEIRQNHKVLSEEGVNVLYITQATVTFDKPIRAPTAGQVNALYYSAQKLMKMASNDKSEINFSCKNDCVLQEDENDVLVVIACG